MEVRVRLAVNGQAVDRAVDVRRSLADFLRDDLALTGTHVGCEHGVCGACTVLVDGESARSCLLLALQLDGAAVTTIEGLTPAAGLSPLQAAFRDCRAHPEIVHDCGRELNPLIVEGMVHGSTAHGIGAALLEEFRYDDAGQLLTSTFMDYLKPTALDVPDIEVGRLEHPSPFTALGAKGVGEGGAIPGPAAVANAVDDALAHLGVVVRSLPITPDAVWRWLARGGQESRA